MNNCTEILSSPYVVARRHGVRHVQWLAVMKLVRHVHNLIKVVYEVVHTPGHGTISILLTKCIFPWLPMVLDLCGGLDEQLKRWVGAKSIPSKPNLN